MPMDESHIETRRHRHGPVETYELFVEDFNRIEGESQSIGSDLTFAVFWLSEAVTSTVAVPALPSSAVRVLNFFLVAIFVGYGMGVYFLWRWYKQENSLKCLMNRIRASQIPQWGQAGKELGVSDFAKLKLEEPQPHVDQCQVVEPPAGGTSS
jgi:hypothetical protein